MAGPAIATTPEPLSSSSPVYAAESSVIEASVAVAQKKSVEKRAAANGAEHQIPSLQSQDAVLEFNFRDLNREDIAPLWSGFGPIVSRELPFAITKFLVFDLLAQLLVRLVNASQTGALEPVQVGVGPTGLAISAFSGALAGIAGAVISHPADLILTLTSTAAKEESSEAGEDEGNVVSPDGKALSGREAHAPDSGGGSGPDWRPILKELLSKEGGVGNLFTGLPARALFFFLVIGLQFFLYDYVKGLFRVGSDDLTLVLDVFYAIRQGLVNMDS